MKILLFFLGLFLSGKTIAQCTYTWERAVEDSTSNIEQKTLSDSYIMGPDGYKLPKKLLDSFISEVRLQKEAYYAASRDSAKAKNEGTIANKDSVKSTNADGNVVANLDFKIFKVHGRDIVHYATTKYSLGQDLIEVHQFEYCEKEWNEDLFQNRVLYTKEFGVIFETQGVAGDPLSIDYHLTYNTCLSKEKNDKVQLLVREIESK